jgi:hypothetical protein
MTRTRSASRWQRGGSGADSQAFGRSTALFNSAIKQAIDNNATRNRAADAAYREAASFDSCPNCGSGAWTQRKAAR